MRQINIKCDKIDNQLIIKYLLSYFCRLNTLKGTAKAPAVDLSKLNTLKRTIRKVIGGGGGEIANFFSSFGATCSKNPQEICYG